MIRLIDTRIVINHINLVNTDFFDSCLDIRFRKFDSSAQFAKLHYFRDIGRSGTWMLLYAIGCREESGCAILAQRLVNTPQQHYRFQFLPY